MTCADCYLPVPKSDLVRVLTEAHPELHRPLKLLAAIFHFETQDELERLQEFYRPLDPAERGPSDDPARFLAEVEHVLAMANFLPLDDGPARASRGATLLADLQVKTDEAGVRRWACRRLRAACRC
jgi:hypothetical protein